MSAIRTAVSALLVVFGTSILEAQTALRERGAAEPPLIEAARIGTVSRMPDRAELRVTVDARAPRAADAGATNARITRRVIDALLAFGIARDQLSTVGYTVQPVYTFPPRGRPRVFDGYVSRNTVMIDVRAVERLGQTIDVALGAGANDIQGVRFFIADEEGARRDALRAATIETRAAAEAMARAAGGTLGALVWMTTQGTDDSDFSGSGIAGGSDLEARTTPILIPTTQRFSERVVARWQFVPGTP